jgi:hypothetical protein
MQSLMQQRIDGLQALRLRTVIATSDFYSLIGKEPPVQKVRFQVKTVGPKAYHIIDLITGKTRGFRFEYARAVGYAIQLEEDANSVPGGVL